MGAGERTEKGEDVAQIGCASHTAYPSKGWSRRKGSSESLRDGPVMEMDAGGMKEFFLTSLPSLAARWERDRQIIGCSIFIHD